MWSFFWNDSGAFLCFFLLAQEGEPLLSRIHRNDHKQTKHHQKEESNHAHRIARSRNSVLYRGFANTKQLCKCYFSGIEKKIEVPWPSKLSAQMRPLCASTICFAMDNPNPVPVPVLDLSTR